jgi:alkanesulfonate monooxygenase SsuD/methylene tetrahydromethanopterin reductase-like flavin-dependent oxidoreductase (luciferase family)
LFGFDLADYETLFEEKLDLLVRLLRDQPVTWSGTSRSPLTDQRVYPPLPEGHLPTWVGVGGSPQSVIRAARYGLPLMLAIIGGHPSRFSPYVELYRRALEEYGHPPLPVGMHSPGFVAKTDAEAVDIQWPYWQQTLEAASQERGWARPTASRFQDEIAGGSQYVGSPETVATKLAANIRLLGLRRFDLAYATGAVPHEQRMEMIDLYGREVIPRVRELLDHPPLRSTPSAQRAANKAESRVS